MEKLILFLSEINEKKFFNNYFMFIGIILEIDDNYKVLGFKFELLIKMI